MTVNLWRLVAYLILVAVCVLLFHFGAFEAIIASWALFWVFCQIVSV